MQSFKSSNVPKALLKTERDLWKLQYLYVNHGTMMIVALFTHLRLTFTQTGLLNRAQWQWPILTDDSGVFDRLMTFLRHCQDLNIPMRPHKRWTITLIICVPGIFSDLKYYKKAIIIRNNFILINGSFKGIEK